jgi:hypothetical protein
VTGTGTFDSIYCSNTGTFGSLSAGGIVSGSINASALQTAGGVIVTSGASMGCWNGSSYNFLANGSGQITAAYAVAFFGYNTPTLYNTSGTSVGTITSGSGGHLKWTGTTTNWTPAYTNTCRLQVPYSGLWAISYTLGTDLTAAGEIFISKNVPLSGSSNFDNPGKVLALQGWTSTVSFDANCSAALLLSSSDLLNFGFICSSGTAEPNGRCILQMTLIQRTA